MHGCPRSLSVSQTFDQSFEYSRQQSEWWPPCTAAHRTVVIPGRPASSSLSYEPRVAGKCPCLGNPGIRMVFAHVRASSWLSPHGRHTCDELVKPGSRNVLATCQRHLWALVHPSIAADDCSRCAELRTVLDLTGGFLGCLSDSTSDHTNRMSLDSEFRYQVAVLYMTPLGDLTCPHF